MVIYSKNCLIYKCDEFTREWFKKNLNHNQVDIEPKRQEQRKIQHIVPPHNGYGTPEDSLGNVYHL